MAGTYEGGVKAADTNRQRTPNFYKIIGAAGGRKSRGGGFAKDPQLAKEAGSKGGKAPRRTTAATKAHMDYLHELKKWNRLPFWKRVITKKPEKNNG